MKIEHRKPRATRFEADNPEVRLARLREQAPDLGSTRRLRFVAIMGSILVLLTVAAFAWTMRIYRAVAYTPVPESIEVEMAPELLPDEIDKVLERVEAESADAEAAFRDQLTQLKGVDLLNDADPDSGTSSGEENQ